MDEPFQISSEVKTALNRGTPVVALESTVIAHGLPGEKGLDAALAMIHEVEAENCQPAVIGIIEGKIKVGLSSDEIERLARSEEVMKVSSREIALALTAKKDGATTVAATAYIAVNAGIPVIATGGIGGVHRDAKDTWDVSADLWELVKTPAVVVCSGAKAILDLPSTVEWLETYQVPIYGYGTDEFPGFYSRETGIKVHKLDKPEEVVDLYLTRLGLGQRSGMVIAVPIPEEDAVDLQNAADEALDAARTQNITGPALTPWLLGKVQEIAGDAAVQSNMALLANNARIAAQIASAMSGRREKRIGFHQ